MLKQCKILFSNFINFVDNRYTFTSPAKTRMLLKFWGVSEKEPKIGVVS